MLPVVGVWPSFCSTKLHLTRLSVCPQQEEAEAEAAADDGSGGGGGATPLPSTTIAITTRKAQPLLARPFSRPNWALTVGSLIYGLVSTFVRVPIGWVRACRAVYCRYPYAPSHPHATTLLGCGPARLNQSQINRQPSLVSKCSTTTSIPTPCHTGVQVLCHPELEDGRGGLQRLLHHDGPSVRPPPKCYMPCACLPRDIAARERKLLVCHARACIKML